MQRRITDTLRARLELDDALKVELDLSAGWPDLLPVSPADQAASSAPEPWLIAADARLSAETLAEEAAVISATKWRLGRRPVAAIPLVERVLYRGLTRLLSDGLAEPREPEDHAEFQKAPLDAGYSHGFVLTLDLAHYYATLDLELLGSELIERTGEWEATQVLVSFLRRLSPTIGGIPQGSRTSDLLGDTYAETLHHRLVRRGLECWRYADDYRIWVPSYSAAVSALDTFDEEARKMGLFLNERKTTIKSLQAYEDFVSRPVQALTEAWEQKRTELTMVDFYSAIEVPPDGLHVLQAVASDELAAWAEEVDEFGKTSDLDVSARIDLKLVIQVLQKSGDLEGIRHAPTLLQGEAIHTPVVCRYLEDLLETDADEAWNAAAEATQVDSLTEWQKMWLLSAVALPAPDTDSARSQVRDWSSDQLSSQSPVVRAQAQWTCAVQGQLTRESWEEEISTSDYFVRERLAAASALIPELPSKAKLSDITSVAIHDWASDEYVAQP